MRAEQIASQHLRSNMGQGSTQTVVIKITNSLKYSFLIWIQLIQLNLIQLIVYLKALGVQCCASTGRGSYQGPSEELRAYRVLGVIDKVSSLVTSDATFLPVPKFMHNLKSTLFQTFFLCVCY